MTAATFDTSLGAFTMTLNSAAAPIAAANFVALARCGFYDGITFHRVLTGFVAQAGDPNTRQNQGDFEGLGTGGPGYRFVVELPPEGLDYDPYTVAMANTGAPDSNGSQFFICLSDLDAQFVDATGQPQRIYTIFGLVTDGRDVVDAIGQVEVSSDITGVPVDPVVIRSIELTPEESTPSGS
ncbi:MAG: peptidylprolyl isomerase [Candidatus Limnocylindria bacterium]